MLRPRDVRFCAACGAGLAPEGDALPKRCVREACAHVHYGNPVPVVAAIVELPGGVVLAHDKDWPDGMFGPITGFIEAGEDPATAVLREVEEELGLRGDRPALIGAYGFEAQNQVIIAYHVEARGDVVLGDELDAFKVIAADKLRSWPFGTGLAVRDWLRARQQTEEPQP